MTDGCATTFRMEASERTCCKYRIATGTAMTVGRIMILLYGAGGEPGGGAIPMMRQQIAA